ncbi:hypothetical protein MRY16398_17420 [Phytobacter sp. MRY16-398]|jgi:hypothetical protein|nr:hypothetical protein MRY16398_17420 [Phytobacter sp. MRY16-398]
MTGSKTDMPFFPWAFNGSLTAPLPRIILFLTKERKMNLSKLTVIAIFLLMAIGGIGGVMLAGYSFIVRGGAG